MIICPITREYCMENCAFKTVGGCKISYFFDNFVSASNDLEDIASVLKGERADTPACILLKFGQEQDCQECDCYDEKLECCQFAGQKGLIKKLYDDAMNGLFKDSAIKEE